MNHTKTLIFIPTYNESHNVEKMVNEINRLKLDCDILFIDDNSPDGTAKILEQLTLKHPNLIVKCRDGKWGIGSAHTAGILYAYQHNYDFLITMDADFTHQPSQLPKLLAVKDNYDLVIGSRFVEKNSMPDWTLFRKSLTFLAHFLTKRLLGLTQDSSTAFRLYNLKKIPSEIFSMMHSTSYSFFFESLFIIKSQGVQIKEVPILLYPREKGRSKLNIKEALRSGIFLLKLTLEKFCNYGQFKPRGKDFKLDTNLIDNQNWNSYWKRKKTKSALVYEVIASCYRKLFIRYNLEKNIKKNFSAGAELLHAGCGSGQVDVNLHAKYKITAIDISPYGLDLYSKNNPAAAHIVQADLLNLNLPSASYDGIYNLGVLEHFSQENILHILEQFKRLLKPNGKIIIFWPHRFSTSVWVIKFIHFILNSILKKNVQLHPPEPSLVKNKKSMLELFNKVGLDLEDYHFGLGDLFVQVVLVAKAAP